MTDDDRYKLFGVYLSEPTVDALAESLYEEAGVVDLETYFDETADFVPAGDPGADATDALLADVLESFATRYDEAAFETAETVDPDSFTLVHLAAKPRRVTELRERFQAAATIQETDLRTVQTAILAAHLETELEA
ncbi:hypothetical protein [Natronorubrum texcoconense]|uniref:Uncharacterized protein n=1 Tax=Natronorubrum texcoconense TaxID=1095776 RepID=A0A1G8VBY3_9EURY|nr:hypothetical protein [Natronorubrum texcoconense]SDJ63601.1 hypothetical protein SAMN04515672_1270 [Natronorubrum texcoconense]